MKRSTLLTLVFLVGIGGVLLWSTMRSQNVECTVCMEFGGGRNCATAIAVDEAEAARSAQATACGVLTAGMNESIACANRPPVERSCRAR
jgi:hypothetical protein